MTSSKMSKLLVSLLFAGTAFTMAACSEQKKEEKEETGSAVESMVEDVATEAGDTAESAGEAMADAADSAMEATAEAAEGAGDMMAEATDGAADMAEDAMEAAGDMAESASDTVEGAVEDASDAVEDAAEAVTGAAEVDAEAALALANSSGCMACHKVDMKVIGPAFKEIAAKYAGDANAHANLVESISNGSSGKWGGMAMPGNAPRVNDADIATLASYILSLK